MCLLQQHNVSFTLNGIIRTIYAQGWNAVVELEPVTRKLKIANEVLMIVLDSKE